jgi:hypothetical protein
MRSTPAPGHHGGILCPNRSRSHSRDHINATLAISVPRREGREAPEAMVTDALDSAAEGRGRYRPPSTQTSDLPADVPSAWLDGVCSAARCLPVHRSDPAPRVDCPREPSSPTTRTCRRRASWSCSSGAGGPTRGSHAPSPMARPWWGTRSAPRRMTSTHGPRRRCPDVVHLDRPKSRSRYPTGGIPRWFRATGRPPPTAPAARPATAAAGQPSDPTGRPGSRDRPAMPEIRARRSRPGAPAGPATGQQAHPAIPSGRSAVVWSPRRRRIRCRRGSRRNTTCTARRSW